MGVKIEEDGAGGVVIAIKAVPGAKIEAIAGPLGERLKVRVSAPPEGGKANRAICGLLAGALGVAARDVEVVRGQSGAEKVVRVAGLSVEEVRGRLGV